MSQAYARIKEARDYITSKTSISPKIGMILGSGLGRIADGLENAIHIPYEEIPHFHGTNVEGHAGVVTLGTFDSVPTVILRGRFHRYEGYPMEEVVFPTRVVCALGIQTLVLTNAAGGINTRFRAGDIMLIQDHINFMGDNPLLGPNLKELGPRFPDMTEAYHFEATEILRRSAVELDIPVQSGVYIAVLGPTYETPAEIRMLRSFGADAVGMSTVPEAIAANHLGVHVVGVSAITNLAAGISNQKLSHQEVMENSKVTTEKITRLLKHATPKLVDSF